jgi:hypothetical protein
VTKTDLQNDLLADLQGAANARPLPASHPLSPPPPPLPVTPTAQLRPPTPALEVRLTPLRWVRPAIAPAGSGLGLGLRVGPVQVSLSLGS